MNVVLLGATRGMGRALARTLASRGHRLFLLGRNEDELQAALTDLSVISATSAVGYGLCDLLEPASFEPALQAAEEELDGLDCVVVTAGAFGQQEELEQNQELRDRVLTADFTNTIHFCEAARLRLVADGGGTLCVFSSVAGDRARKPVILYGAAKAGLTYYLNGLDHKFSSQGLRVVLVKPGFVKTSMTAGLPAPPFAGEPEDVAGIVARELESGRRTVVYAPGIWRWVMLVIRFLPRAVMRRIGF